MSGSVLPISPPPELRGASAETSSSVNREARDNSQYESVSRQERQRLERREAAHAANSARQDQRIEDRRAERGQADKSAARVEPGHTRSSQADASTSPASTEEGPAEGNLHGPEASPEPVAAEVVTPDGFDEMPREATSDNLEGVFTFAELQALVSDDGSQPFMAMQGVIPGVSGQAQVATPQLAGMVDAMLGNKGNTLPGQSKSSAESTLKLMESLVGQLSADAGKPADPGAAIASRFQGTLDLAGQSLTGAAGQKPLETAIPLRSYATSVELPVGHAEWGDKLMGKLAWLTSQNMSMAEIHLTPPDMGPMEVRVQVQNDQATVTVHTSNSAVRDQLELHSHRLRDMLGSQGLGLESFDVSDSSARSGQDQRGDQSDNVNGDGVVSALDENEPVDSQGILDLSWKGELDIYA